MVWCKATRVRRVSVLYLYCGVLDAKLVVQLTANTTKGLSKIKPSQVVYHGAAEHDLEEHLWI